MNRLELAEIVNQLSNNVDEADQFSQFMPDIIKHCDKKFLIKLGNELADIIENNRRLGNERLQVDSNDEIDRIIKLIRKYQA